jgi:signal transduction histidine kinase
MPVSMGSPHWYAWHLELSLQVPRLTRPSIDVLRSRWPWWLAALTLTLGLFVASTVGWYWYVDQRDAQERRLALDLLWLEQNLQQTLQLNEHMVVNWAHDLTPFSVPSLVEFQSRVAGLQKDNPALLAVDVVDADGRRLGGLPQYQERPGQLPPLTDPLIHSAVTRSHTIGKPAYSRVIEQGAPLWVLAIPVEDDNRDHGSVLVTYDLARLLELEVPWWFIQRYDLSLVDRNNKRLSPRDGNLTEDAPEVHKLNFGPDDSGLTLWAGPHAQAQPQPLLLTLSAAVLMFGLLIAWLLRVLYRWLRERQTAQKALSDSRAQLYAVLNGLEATVSVSALDDGRLLFRNLHHMQLFALEPDGDCCLLLYPHATRPPGSSVSEFFDAISRRWYQQERRSMQWVDGSTVLLEIATDITAQREAAATAHERDELLQHTARLASLAEFASGIAHELNQPLAAIANYAAVAASFLGGSPPQLTKVEDAVQRMGEESRRAGHIIQSLRSFIEKRAVDYRNHRVADLLVEPMALVAPLAQRLRVQVRLINEAPQAQIDCDGVMIEQVVFNLLRNALEAVAIHFSGIDALPTAEAVVLRIRLSDDTPHMTLCVEDRGVGVAEPARLFQAFYTTKSEGMGLGLAICRTVIESHGGRLWYEAQTGGGSRLCFRLPLSAESALSI